MNARKKSILETLDSNWITTGPKVKKFEELFSNYIGCKHSIALNSCTAALHLSLLVNNISKDDEVIIPIMTFAATANVVIHCNAKPVFCDINPETLNIDVNKIEKLITKKTKAIIPVHIAGQPCEMDTINYLANKYNLKIIEDAAHATEAYYKGKKIGFENISCFSFYATKNITTAEGGMLTTNNDLIAEKVRILSLHGMSKDAWKRYSNEGYKHYDIIYPGFKYNMTDIQASLGICQLEKINNFLKRRNEIKKLYDNLLSEVEEISVIKEIDNIVHARHLYIIKLSENIDRDKFMNQLINQNIGVSVHFLPLHFHSYYKKTFNLKNEDFPNATNVGNRILSLPFYPKLKDDEVIYITDKIKEIINNSYIS
ncbi:MAG: spore coat protein [Candidatus Sericytochromatia bacterium]|nr:MAG: spore coat protein [Candidatus Sericytochromatia bacterium]